MIELPPLRERKADIPLLVDYFTAMYAGRYHKAVHAVDPLTLKKLGDYHWPGNIRELRHAVERAVITADSDTLFPKDFCFSFSSDVSESAQNGLLITDLHLEHVEKTVVQRALKKHDGNISKTAEELGLNRASLYRRINKYGL